MEQIVLEIPIVGYFSGLVVQLTFTAHQVVFPLPFVASSLLVGIFTVTFTLTINFVTLVSTPILEFIDGEDRLIMSYLKLLRLLRCRGLQLRR